jgi:hypothetical protein
MIVDNSDLEIDDSDYECGYTAYFMQMGHPPHDYYEVEPHIIDENPQWTSYETAWITDDYTIEDALADLNGWDNP